MGTDVYLKWESKDNRFFVAAGKDNETGLFCAERQDLSGGQPCRVFLTRNKEELVAAFDDFVRSCGGKSGSEL